MKLPNIKLPNIKLTRFSVFVLILFVLVIFIMMGSFCNKESFVAFQKEEPVLNSVFIPQYSKTKNVYKLYDNLYFDNKNGNLIEVNGEAYEETATVDMDSNGTSITGIIISKRVNNPTVSNSTVTYDTSGLVAGDSIDTEESLISSILPSMNSWVYTSQCENTTKKVVMYIPWNTNTYIIVLERTSESPVTWNIHNTFYFGSDDTKVMGSNGIHPLDITKSIIQNVDTSNLNQIVSETDYNNRSVYQLNDKIKYDIKTSNLVLNTTDTTVNIYDRNKNSKTASDITDAMTVENITFNPWYLTQSNSGDSSANYVVYMPNGVNTIVCIFGYSSSEVKFKLLNVVRYNTTEAVKILPSTTVVETTTTATVTPETENSTSEDYILKTQIVPPVCPAFPEYPTTVKCSNCGDNDSSTTTGSTKNGTGQTIASGLVQGTGDVATGLVQGTGDVASNLISETGGVAKELVGETGGLVRDVAGETGGLVRDAAGGAGGLVRDAAGGTIDIVSDIAGGLSPLFNYNPTQVQQTQQPNNQQTQPNNQQTQQPTTQRTTAPYLGTNHVSGQVKTDNYSYFGKLPSNRASNYMPITTDFSSFSQ